MSVFFCKDCETIATPVICTPGSIWIELVLWLCLVIPGLIYSFWRINRRHEVCKICGSSNIIPSDSPAAQRLTGNSSITGDHYVANPSPSAINAGRTVGRLVGKLRK